MPTFCFDEGKIQLPGPLLGRSVSDLPKDVESLYEVARQCLSVNSPTAAAMVCRKILMHVAVEKGAKKGETFKAYVNFLYDQHHIPEASGRWVDHIRNKGNDANHEISLVSKEDAKGLVGFTEVLLKIIYEFPAQAPHVPASESEPPTTAGT